MTALRCAVRKRSHFRPGTSWASHCVRHSLLELCSSHLHPLPRSDNRCTALRRILLRCRPETILQKRPEPALAIPAQPRCHRSIDGFGVLRMSHAVALCIAVRAGQRLLPCFVSSNLRIARIDSPLLLATDGQARLDCFAY